MSVPAFIDISEEDQVRMGRPGRGRLGTRGRAGGRGALAGGVGGAARPESLPAGSQTSRRGVRPLDGASPRWREAGPDPRASGRRVTRRESRGGHTRCPRVARIPTQKCELRPARGAAPQPVLRGLVAAPFRAQWSRVSEVAVSLQMRPRPAVQTGRGPWSTGQARSRDAQRTALDAAANSWLLGHGKSFDLSFVTHERIC